MGEGNGGGGGRVLGGQPNLGEEEAQAAQADGGPGSGLQAWSGGAGRRPRGESGWVGGTPSARRRSRSPGARRGSEPPMQGFEGERGKGARVGKRGSAGVGFCPQEGHRAPAPGSAVCAVARCVEGAVSVTHLKEGKRERWEVKLNCYRSQTS